MPAAVGSLVPIGEGAAPGVIADTLGTRLDGWWVGTPSAVSVDAVGAREVRGTHVGNVVPAMGTVGEVAGIPAAAVAAVVGEGRGTPSPLLNTYYNNQCTRPLLNPSSN